MRILLADRQDITRMGLVHIIQQMNVGDKEEMPGIEWKYVEDKAELMLALKDDDDAVVVLDYTLFDINDANLADSMTMWMQARSTSDARSSFTMKSLMKTSVIRLSVPTRPIFCRTRSQMSRRSARR